jgi:hypothetical protein
MWRILRRGTGFLIASGILAGAVSLFLDWLREEPPPLVTELACEVAQSASGDGPPPLDPTQPVTVSVGEALVCGVDQEGGDYLVWRGGGNGFGMRAGPVRSAQEERWLDRLRQRLQPPNKPQITACVATARPVLDRIPSCRHTVTYSAPGTHLLTVRVSKRGSFHVEELTLPIRVVDSGTVLRLPPVQIVPRPGTRETARTAPVSETLEAPGGLLAPPRVEERRLLVIPAGPGESVVPGSERLTVKSSNGANVSLQSAPQGVTAVVTLRSGPGFDKRRSWLSADVSATLRSQVEAAPVEIDSTTLRVPSRREVYGQPVPEGATVRLNGNTLALGAWFQLQGARVRYLRTETGLAVEANHQ